MTTSMKRLIEADARPIRNWLLQVPGSVKSQIFSYGKQIRDNAIGIEIKSAIFNPMSA